MSLQVAMGYDEILAVGDLNLFLAKSKELCEMKLHGKFFPGMEREDVVQEVLIKVYQAINSFDSSKAKASTFFENVINHRIADCIRKVTSERYSATVNNTVEIVTDQDTDDAKVGTYSYIGSEDSNYACAEYMMDFMLNIGLDDREKQIFQLRCSGYDFVEIAQLLHLTKARISQLWKGILKKYEGV
jgi:RNA polymerase sporulation-specific sigma factor